MTSLADLSVAAASGLIARREISPVELTDAVLERMDAVEPMLHTAITVVAERARDQARIAEQDIAAFGPRTPLHGIPFGLKDNIFTAGIRTTANSRLLKEHVPSTSATVHRRLEASGAILVAKLSTYEFGTGTGADLALQAFAPARNPWNPDHFTGGSSIGAGAAVAAGTALFAIGADTGGSIRLPAAGCGLVGLKPTYGLVSRAGVLPNAWSLDHVGPITRTAKDAALILSEIAGHDPLDAFSAHAPTRDFGALATERLEGVRIGFTRSLDAADACPQMLAAFDDTLKVLAELGATLVPIDLPGERQAYIDCQRIINTSECYSLHQATWAEHRWQMAPALADKFANGACLNASDYLRAQRWRRLLVAGLVDVMTRCDVLLSAAVATPAPLLADLAAVANFATLSGMAPFSLSGQPSLTMPVGFSTMGLPLSVQLSAAHFAEPMLLRVAGAYERATVWSAQRPPSHNRSPAALSIPKKDLAPALRADERAIGKLLANRAGISAPSEQDLWELVAANARMTAHVARMPQLLPSGIEPDLARLHP